MSGKSICVESPNEVCVMSHQNKDEERKKIWKVCKEFFTLSLLFEKKNNDLIDLILNMVKQDVISH